MPIYEYKCNNCKKELETMQSINEKPLKDCPSCGGNLIKIISSSSFVLKGSGWYKTDYAANKPAPKSSEKNKSKTENSPACSACPSASACES